MARKRMIDPNIWQSEDFGKLSILAKLVFIGLFSLADDEGRGRANPTYIKSCLFPYDEDAKSADIEGALLEIDTNMSINLYSCDGKWYYELLSWDVFQKIDRPTASILPKFEEGKDGIRRIFDESSSSAQRKLVPKRIEKNRKEKEEKEKGTEDVEKFVEIYSCECSLLPQIRIMTDARKKAVGKFLKTYTLKDWEEVCKTTASCDFLLGENDSGWKADFDFLIKPDNATKVLEGRYSGTRKTNRKQGASFEDLKEELENDQGGNGTNFGSDANIISEILPEYDIS